MQFRASQRLGLALAFCYVLGVSAREQFYSELKACPVSCSSTEDASQWTLYDSLNRLTYCEEPVLFQVSLSGTPLTRTQLNRVRACTARDSDEDERFILNAILPPPEGSTEGPKGVIRRSAECPAATRNSTSLELVSRGGRTRDKADAVLQGIEELRNWVQKSRDCQSSTVTFAYNNGTVLGYFGGRRVDGDGTSELFDTLAQDVLNQGAPHRLLLQHCAHDDQNDSKITGGVTVGVVADTEGGFVAVQRILREWKEGHCVVDDSGSTEVINGLSLHFRPAIQGSAPSRHTISNETLIKARQHPAECRWIRVEENDSCGQLAERCGITGAQYMQINSAPNHCSTLRPGQAVCCSGGRLPELRPRPNADGSCYVYDTKPDDACSVIAAWNGLEMEDIFEFNRNTWGWSGCDPLFLGVNICLSPGSPPMPKAVDNAVCGPTVPDSRPPRGDMTLADINPCPLRACCNIWGQCGTTADFCVNTTSSSVTGAPGTAAPGTHGCVQNCGMDIVNNNVVPEKFYKLGYFEGWNMNRDCLRMDVLATQDHHQDYTDVHFAFAHIGPAPNFEVVIPEDSEDQFRRFLTIRGPRRTLAFGGWVFSAERPHFDRFRQATRPENRQRFAQNCVDFAIEHNLDGLDFDWEYPSAPDLPGIPPGDLLEADNYYEFLRLVKERLPERMTLSIAAPASFWYLRPFPLDRMHRILDYIVYMTYDLHGQWDAGNQWSNPACPTGNCLRSHVNWTETYNALTMITKAGVPAHKVLMGVASYGRSFKMSQAGCSGPQCFFLGDNANSQAKKGRCTDTAGYLANAEIFEQIDEGYTDIGVAERATWLVYDDTEWVSYLDDDQRIWREQQADRYNLGGTIEWAIDLQEFLDGAGLPSTRDNLWEPIPECEEESPHDTLEALENDRRIPSYCLPIYSLEVLRKLAQRSIEHYNELINGPYDRNFRLFRQVAATATIENMDTWVQENAATYFNCASTVLVPCCRFCLNEDCGTGSNCIRTSDSGPGLQCAFSRHVETNPIPRECPPVWTVEPATTGNLTFTFKNDTAREAFYEAVAEEVGIIEEQVVFRTREYKRHLRGFPWESCVGAISGTTCVGADYRDIPVANYFPRDVPNPRDLIEPAVGQASDITAALFAYEWGIRLGILAESAADIVDAMTVPVLMLNDSVHRMQEVNDMGEEIHENNTENLILAVLESVLFIIPFVGQLVGSMVRVAQAFRALYIRSAANTIGDVGLISIDIYRITQAETDDERAMLGLGIALTGMGTLAGIPDVLRAGQLRRRTGNDAIIRLTDAPDAARSRYMMSGALSSCSRPV